MGGDLTGKTDLTLQLDRLLALLRQLGLRRDVETLKKTAVELLEVAEKYNASYWTLWAKPILGWISAQEGEIEAGIAQMHESTAELQKQLANLWVPQTLLLEAEVLGRAGHYQRAYRLLDEAQALIEPLEQRFYEAELHRVRGVLLSEGSDVEVAAASLERAIAVARRQNAGSKLTDQRDVRADEVDRSK